MDQFIARVRALLQANSYLLVVSAVTLVCVLAAAWVAVPARKQSAVLAAEDERLQALVKSSGLWVTQFEPASNEEAGIWQLTQTDVAALGVKPSERLTLAQIVARRAEDSGLGGAHIKFVETAPSGPGRQVAGVTFNPAAYKLDVTGTGSLSTVSRFIGSLPPAVQLESVSMARSGDDGVSVTISLSVFEPAG